MTISTLFRGIAIMAPALTFALRIQAQVTLPADTVLCEGEPFTLTATVNGQLESTSYTITTIPFVPEVIGGTQVTLTDDAVTGALPIGFSFCFFGSSYTNFYIGSNGWISFSSGQPATYTSSTIPNTGTNVPKNCIMGPWQDWHPGVGGAIRYQTIGTAPFRKLVVTWDNVPMFSCTGNLGKFQIVCHETTSIIENHIWNKPSCTWAGGTAVQGLHNAAGTQAFVVPGRNSTSWTATNDSRRYTPNGLSWYANGVFVGNGMSIEVDPDQTTTYVATATLCNNTTSSDTTIVAIGLPLSFTNSATTITECTENTGSITVDFETESDGPFSFQWNDENNSTTQNLENLGEGFYTLTITDIETGCAIDTTFEITTEYQIQIFTSGSDINCADGSDGEATAFASNGTGTYTYEWNDPLGQTGPTASNLGVGTWTVTATDEIGCSETAQVQIQAPAALEISVTNSTFPLCFGLTTGAATVDAGGGVPGYEYSWSNGATGPSISGVGAGQYFVTVTDANGCDGELQVNIIQPQPINPNPDIQDPTCAGFTNGYIDLQTVGGTPPFEYFWPQSGNTTDIESNLDVGTYSYQITDANGCTYSGQIELQPTAPMFLDIADTDVTCFGEDDGTATALPTGGTPGYTYQWNDEDNQTTETATGLEPGTYSVVVTDAFGCQQTLEVEITEPQALNATISSSTDSPCAGGGAGGSATVDVQGGSPGFTYQWSNGQTGQTATGLGGGNYTVTVTDANGCTDLASVSIDEPEEIEVSLSGVDPSCNGENDGSASADVEGGVGPYTYEWTGGSTSANVTGLEAGTVTVEITDANGCTVTESIVLDEPSPLSGDVIVDDASCGLSNGSATVTGLAGGSPPYLASWVQQGLTGNSIDDLAAGTFTVIIEDDNGCTITETYTVGETDFPVASASADVYEGPQPLNVTFSNTSQNGDVFEWNFGDGSTQTAENQGAIVHTYSADGTYEVEMVAISPGGCTDTTYLSIFVFSDSFLVFPNVFTPGPDGMNTTFKPIEAGQLRGYTLIIFDRWGNEVFSTSNPDQGWTGKNGGGDDMPEGTYYFVVEATGFDGEKYDKGGSFTLLRQ